MGKPTDDLNDEAETVLPLACCPDCGAVLDLDPEQGSPHCGGEAGHRCRGVPLPADEFEALFRDDGNPVG